jgi:ABC-type glycerol-3-phosphate transport system permease component
MWRGAARQVPLLLVAVTILLPLYFMVVNSFKSNDAFFDSPLSPPNNISLRAYREAISGRHVGTLFLNSAIISISSVAVATAVSALAAFALAKLQFRGRDMFFRAMLPLMVVPPITLLIPQFKLMSAAGLVNHRLSVIVIYVGLMLPFTIYLLRNFFISFPNELLDAAVLDGCSNLVTLRRVVLPMSYPALITAGLVNFVFAWNELLIALVFLQSEGSRTLVVGLTVFRSRFSLDVPVLMAGLTIATLPVLLVYLVGQRYLVRGLLAGSGK